MVEKSTTIVTANEPKRLIYFRGHPDQPNSALISRVCKDYETVSKILTGSSATKTLYNLCNLHAVRGCVRDGKLDVHSSMSGPHHYFGSLDPRHAHTVEI